jgi:hypothetical protein
MPDPSTDSLLDDLLDKLARRSHADGTTLARPEETASSVEATVWRALALRLAGVRASSTAGAAPPADAAQAANPADAATAVARLQIADGRVSLSPLHPGAYSPTSIAVLAWHGRPEFADERQRAVGFLLAHGGNHFPRDPGSALSMDTDLEGWPWIDRTFSWAEPTALALLALDSARQGEHPRAAEGRAMLLDRQIVSGGWNYGNARVFGTALRPTPESTGLVLAALAGRAPEARVAASLAYLAGVAPALRSPLALGWALLALGAWNGSAPEFAAAAIRDTLARESRYGGYDSAELALLAVAAQAPRGLLAALEESP